MTLADLNLDPAPWVKAFKDFALWLAGQLRVDIRWVIVVALLLLVIRWFTKER